MTENASLTNMKKNLWNFLCAQERIRRASRAKSNIYKRTFKRFFKFQDIELIHLLEPANEFDIWYGHINCSNDEKWLQKMEEHGFSQNAENMVAPQIYNQDLGAIILLQPNLAIRYRHISNIFNEYNKLYTSHSERDELFYFYLNTAREYILNHPNLSSNFLTSLGFKKTLLNSYKKHILEKDRRYLNLTLCPLIESIRRYYVNELGRKDLFKKESPEDISNEREKILWELLQLRHQYFAHDHHFPLKEKDSSRISDLYTGNDLNLTLINDVLMKTVSWCLYRDEERLSTEIKEKKFPKFLDLTDICSKNGKYYHHKLEDYLSSAIKLNNTIENLYGVKASSREAAQIINTIENHIGFTPTEYELRNYKIAITLVRNFALHDHLPLLTEKELKEREGTKRLTQDLIQHIEDIQKRKKFEAENKRRRGLRKRLAESISNEEKKEIIMELLKNNPVRQQKAKWLRIIRPDRSRKPTVIPETFWESLFKGIHGKSPEEMEKERLELEKKAIIEAKQGNFGRTNLRKIKERS